MGIGFTAGVYTVSLVVPLVGLPGGMMYQEQIGFRDAVLLWQYWHTCYRDHLNYDVKKHRITLNCDGDQVIFRLPPLFNPAAEGGEPSGNYLVMLLEAGQGSCGYFEDGELVAHRVFRGYMVRKKRGKAQITYLKRKGKSRAGSRIRLNATTLFIQEVIEWINDRVDPDLLERIVLAVSPQFWPLFYQQPEHFFFDQRDHRIIAPGVHWIKAGYKEMLYVAKQCHMGVLIDSTGEGGAHIIKYCTLPQSGGVDAG